MEQAGINSIRLIENKDITFKFADDNSVIDALIGDGNVFDIQSVFPILFSILPSRDNNGKLSYMYELEIIVTDYSIVHAIKRSIYGFILVIDFFNGEKKILMSPLNFAKSKQNNNVSASYSLNLSNLAKTNNELIDFNNNKLVWILETGYWNNNGYWINSAFWIN